MVSFQLKNPDFLFRNWLPIDKCCCFYNKNRSSVWYPVHYPPSSWRRRVRFRSTTREWTRYDSSLRLRFDGIRLMNLVLRMVNSAFKMMSFDSRRKVSQPRRVGLWLLSTTTFGQSRRYTTRGRSWGSYQGASTMSSSRSSTRTWSPLSRSFTTCMRRWWRFHQNWWILH